MQDKRVVIAQGRTAEIFADGKNHILKLFRSGIPSQLIEEEFRISLSVYQSGISMPEPVKMIDLNDRKGIIYQRVFGNTMLKAIIKKPWSINKEAIRMARIHEEIHQKKGLDLPSQKELLNERIEQAPILTTEEKEKIINHLMSLKEDAKLCHGDFHPDNIIRGDKDWTIDWMTGMKGNPAGDVARTILIFQHGTMPEQTPKILVWLFGHVRNQILKKYSSHYFKNSGIKQEEVEEWIVPIAAARLSEWLPEKEKQQLVEVIRKRIADGIISF